MSKNDLTASRIYHVCKRFVRDCGIAKVDISSCTRNLVQAVGNMYLEVDSEDALMRLLYSRFFPWVRKWRARQNGTFYGKYARLAGKITDSGVIYNPRLFRVRMAYQTLKGFDYSKSPRSVTQVTKDVLRLLKIGATIHSKNPLATLASVVSRDTQWLKSIYNAYYEVEGLEAPSRLQDIYASNGKGASWKTVSIRNLTPELCQTAKRINSALQNCENHTKCEINRLSAALNRYNAKSSLEVVKLALQRFGYANTVIFLADFGATAGFSEALITRAKAVSKLLLSCDTESVEKGLWSVDTLIATARFEYSKFLKKQKIETTSVFG